MTQTSDDVMTEIGTPLTPRPSASRRRKPSPLDPRRAPGAFAGAPQAPETTEAAAGAPAPARASSGIAAGVAVIRAGLRTMPAAPGVYRMLDCKGDALYIGKARNLKSRVQNYAHP